MSTWEVPLEVGRKHNYDLCLIYFLIFLLSLN